MIVNNSKLDPVGFSQEPDNILLINTFPSQSSQGHNDEIFEKTNGKKLTYWKYI